MIRYLVSRTVQAIVALAILSAVIFFLARLTGNPLDLLVPIDAGPEAYAHMEKALGLDRPLPVQYAIFVLSAAKGDLGKSLRNRRPVLTLFAERFPNSLMLGAVSMAITLLVGIPLGVAAALKSGTFIDTYIRIFATLGQAVPHFWLGIMFIYIFAQQMRILPAVGMGGPSHYVLPAFVLAWGIMAGVTRLLRTGMLDVMNAEFVRYAYCKGLSETRIVSKHVLRNALIPVVSFAGVYFALFISGSVIVETVFAWPGAGRLLYDAIMTRDFPVLQGGLLLTAALVISVNLLIDILYGFLDPRIRYQDA